MFYCKIDDDLELRLIQIHDTLHLFKLIDKNRQHLRPWLSWVDEIISPQQYFPIIAQWLNEYAEQTGIRAGIFHKGKLTGCIELHRIDFYHRHAGIGYFLAKKAEGKGMMTRSVKAVIDHSFLHLRLNRLEIRVAEENFKSRAVAEHLGFTMEGKVRQGEFLHGRFHDVMIYGLLADEWSNKVKY